jgi:hypothetical protein
MVDWFVGDLDFCTLEASLTEVSVIVNGKFSDIYTAVSGLLRWHFAKSSNPLVFWHMVHSSSTT